MKNNERLNYTMVLHSARIALKLSCNEFCLADTIYHLSNNLKGELQGWCYASKETLGKCLGLSKQTIFQIISRLLNKNLIQKQHKTGHLRTTELWYQNVILLREQTVYQKSLPRVKRDGKESALRKRQESLPNNNKDKEIKPGFPLGETDMLLLQNKDIQIYGVRYQDPAILKILGDFSDTCLQYCGLRPVLREKEYFAILRATKRLSLKQLGDHLNMWIYNDLARNKDRVDILKALSDRNITGWLAENA